MNLSGPLAAILKFTQKCKQTAVSQKLSKIKNFFKIFFHLMRYLNCWDNKNFWGAQLVPPSPATSVNAKFEKLLGTIFAEPSIPKLRVAWLVPFSRKVMKFRNFLSNYLYYIIKYQPPSKCYSGLVHWSNGMVVINAYLDLMNYFLFKEFAWK